MIIQSTASGFCLCNDLLMHGCTSAQWQNITKQNLETTTREKTMSGILFRLHCTCTHVTGTQAHINVWTDISVFKSTLYTPGPGWVNVQLDMCLLYAWRWNIRIAIHESSKPKQAKSLMSWERMARWPDPPHLGRKATSRSLVSPRCATYWGGAGGILWWSM